MKSRCVHAGIEPEPKGAVVPPIYQTSTFSFKSAAHGAALFQGKEKGYIYTRLGNPTIEAMERAVADLEGGYDGMACSSGMAAIHTVLATFLHAGDHVVSSESVYGPVTSLLNTVMARLGIETTFVDSSNTAAVAAAIRPETKLIHVETPGNPTLVVTDLAAVAALAHKAGARLMVDNTFLSPVLQQPLALGADIVIHSLTKFINGHADVVGGIIVPKTEADYKAIRATLSLVGSTLGPHDAFLVHRGLKTLCLRMARSCENALKIAEWLDAHPAVEWVRYPYLASDPQHELSRRQAKGGGGVVSFGLNGGFKAGVKMMESVELFALAVSLGGVESLIQHPASMTHANMKPELREQAGISDGLVRISVGIEDADELIADLERGL
ncbi:MAG: aminotransferase class I/II-fold pyridoxal phosphate-dependent enzyme [Candidatus Krumholzibacteriota bacterium]|nr:aminotransferase class I/II-fold pyridoxal phosphate-dependent enzyme [Candidatus Krumholzibacteriota bacterium]